jgi:hypothetical protein
VIHVPEVPAPLSVIKPAAQKYFLGSWIKYRQPGLSSEYPVPNPAFETVTNPSVSAGFFRPSFVNREGSILHEKQACFPVFHEQ